MAEISSTARLGIKNTWSHGCLALFRSKGNLLKHISCSFSPSENGLPFTRKSQCNFVAFILKATLMLHIYICIKLKVFEFLKLMWMLIKQWSNIGVFTYTLSDCDTCSHQQWFIMRSNMETVKFSLLTNLSVIIQPLSSSVSESCTSRAEHWSLRPSSSV